MTAGRRHRPGQLPAAEAAIVAVNIRTLRQRRGWTQAELGALMGWPNASTVCAAEGRRGGRQRGFTAREVRQLAAIFGVPSRQLTAQCANCCGQPPKGSPAWHVEPLITVDAETGARGGLRVR
jgi:hypothetical protein